VPSCAEGGVLGVLCGAVGSVMATEAVKLICGIGEPLVGRLSVFDAREMSWRTLAVRPDPDRVPVTGLEAEQREPGAGHGIDVHDLARRLAARAAGGDDFVLVDVREPAEREVVTIPGSVGVPMAQLLAAGPAALPDGVPVVLHCRSGARSAQVLAVLHAAGRTDVVHVEGGVLAWVREIDPSLPTD
jgi:adenylyltransferase/sulfurtransferase